MILFFYGDGTHTLKKLRSIFTFFQSRIPGMNRFDCEFCLCLRIWESYLASFFLQSPFLLHCTEIQGRSCGWLRDTASQVSAGWELNDPPAWDSRMGTVFSFFYRQEHFWGQHLHICLKLFVFAFFLTMFLEYGCVLSLKKKYIQKAKHLKNRKMTKLYFDIKKYSFSE